MGNIPGGPLVKTLHFQSRGVRVASSVPSLGPKIPHALQWGKKKSFQKLLKLLFLVLYEAVVEGGRLYGTVIDDLLTGFFIKLTLIFAWSPTWFFLIVNSELKSSSGFTWKERPLIRGSWACAFLSPGLSVNLSSSTYYLSEFFCLKILWSIANMSI